jgi:hypothetical protein
VEAELEQQLTAQREQQLPNGREEDF